MDRYTWIDKLLTAEGKNVEVCFIIQMEIKSFPFTFLDCAVTLATSSCM
jgi:hypothetical protein